MAEKETNPGVQYERKDIRFGGLLAAMIAGICILLFVGYGVWRLYWWHADAQAAAKRSQYSPPHRLSVKLPPAPRLEQLDEMAQKAGVPAVAKRLGDEQEELNRYGASEEKGFVHIPIQEAIKATAGKLPIRKQQPSEAVKDNGLIDAGQSNSGRMFKGESK